jgi:glycosyltransferase involved in cell wall biosynthesis
MEITNCPITVLMPAYNAGGFIAEAIGSVLDQTFANFELLVVNDGSTDNTVAIIKSFNDARIRLINQPNTGVAAALNAGLRAANTPYIARFDADDICHPQRLQLQYEFMLANSDYNIVGSAADYVDVEGQYVFNYQPPAHNNHHIQQLNALFCPFIHSSVFYKKKVVIQAGGYNTNAIGFEDHLLWRMLIKKGKAFNFSQSLIKVRLNPGSVTIDEQWRTPEFRQIKYSAIKKGEITVEDGDRLLAAVSAQNKHNIKYGAYHTLLAKKFLWDNYHPAKARENLKAVIRLNNFSLTSYGLFILSFLPRILLLRIYQTIK